MTNIYAEMIDRLSSEILPSDNAYTGEDGLMRCKDCNGPLQTHIIIPELEIDRIVRCACPCMAKRVEEAEKQWKTEAKRRDYLADASMASWTFENDDRKNPKLSDVMQNYVDSFQEFFKRGKGLLLYGPVGTGKTYYAACIANALIDAGYTVHMTNFARLINQIQSKFDGRQEIIDKINANALLIIDDLGVERRTEYMDEIIYNIIDSRARTGRPCIVTTNLPIEEIKNPSDLAKKRIYDRVLKMCFPVEVTGTSRRRQEVIDTFGDIKEMLGL